MSKPTLEEVKKHFENAEKIKDHAGDVGFIEFDKIRFSDDGRGVNQNRFSKNWLVLWHETEGFAEILTTKEPTYSITADQLMQLENGFTLPKLKEWFPEVFFEKLEVGKWYKDETTPRSLVFITEIININKVLGYGLCGIGLWHEEDLDGFILSGNEIEATKQEVFEALKNEAVKRGFVEGNAFKCLVSGNIFECEDEKKLVDSSVTERIAFKDGIWAKVYQKL